MSQLRFRLPVCLFVALFAAQGSTLADEKPDYPLFVAQSAGLDRFVADIKGVLALAGRKDLESQVAGVLGVLENLKGVDRKKPAGVMLYFSKGGGKFDLRNVPEPSPVFFVPVSSIKDLQTSVAIGPIKLTAEDEDKGWYVLDFSDADGEKIPARKVGSYMFFAPKKSFLERTFPNPEKLIARGKQSADISVAILAQHVPKDLKDMIMDGVRSATAGELKEKPSEAKEDFKVRTELLKKGIAVLESALHHSLEIRLDADIDTGAKGGIKIRASIAAKKDTPFARFLNSTPGISTAFAPIEDQQAPAQAAFALDIGDAIRAFLKTKLGQVEQKALQPLPETDAALLKPMFAAVRRTVGEKQLEAFLKVVGEPPHKFSLLGGVTHKGGKEFPALFAKTLARAVEGYNLVFFAPNAAKHGKHAIHKLQNVPNNNPGIAALFGKKATLYFTVLPEKVLFAFGEQPALAELKSALDAFAKADPIRRPATKMASLHVRLAAWQGIITQQNPDAGDLLSKAFAKGGDEIAFAVERGNGKIIVTATAGPGILRFIGLAIAKGIDEGN